MKDYAVMPLTDYSNICDKVREKTATTENIKSAELSEKIEKVYEAGQQAEYDKFWDTYQQNGERYNYSGAFAYGWIDEIYNPKYPFKDIRYCSGMFTNSVITDTKQEMSFIDGYAGRLPYFMAHFKTIRPIHVTELITYEDAFTACSNLENIAFDGVIGNDIYFGNSPLLTHDSLMSIINALKNFRLTTKKYENVSYMWQASGNEDCKNQTFVISDDENNGHPDEVILTGDDNTDYMVTFVDQGPATVPGPMNSLLPEYTIVLQVTGISKTDAEEMAKATSFMLDDNNTLTLTIEQASTEISKTLTLGSENLAKLTDEEKTVATNKGWALA